MYAGLCNKGDANSASIRFYYDLLDCVMELARRLAASHRNTGKFLDYKNQLFKRLKVQERDGGEGLIPSYL
ncbi:unnamed protein product [Lasius platythorax]|uniref:Uncharacterized protein n=1 Tax=Lasius platythorax TaxID=488582 RepID=A0AAV2MYV1_9HYME